MNPQQRTRSDGWYRQARRSHFNSRRPTAEQSRALFLERRGPEGSE